MEYPNVSEREIVGSLLQKLAEILPDLKIEKMESADSKALWDVGIKVKVGRSSKWLRCEIKAKGEPWYLYQAIGQLTQAPQVKKGDYPVVIAPYISEQGQKVCKEAGIGYIDLTGNVFLRFNSVLIEKVARGKTISKARKRAASKAPFSPKSSRILRVLLENPERTWTFLTLSQEAQVNIRTAFVVTELLKEKAFIGKKRGAISLIKPKELLDYWAENYNYQSNRMLTYFSFSRTFEEFKKNLFKSSDEKSIDYAFTLHSRATLVAPFVRFEDVHLYIKGKPEVWEKELNLKPVESGGTVHLLVPYDEGVFYNRQEVDKLFVVCNTQLYIDLVSYPTRGREQAEFLRKQKINFFKKHYLYPIFATRRESMDRREELRKTTERCVSVLKDKYKVSRVFLIGSLVKGFIHERSDIDLVVEGLSPDLYMKALTELWDLLPAGVELNLIPYEDAFENLREKAINEGELIYG